MEYARVIITDIAYGGDGVGRLADGSVVFVPFTAVGDDVEIEITERKAAFCRGVARKFVAAGQG
ncbi:MAG: TRAM domain-containing protein, partial [Victivallales bacterium]|nr:TRAM domain-containing protein [Victivallales bacterium]